MLEIKINKMKNVRLIAVNNARLNLGLYQVC